MTVTYPFQAQAQAQAQFYPDLSAASQPDPVHYDAGLQGGATMVPTALTSLDGSSSSNWTYQYQPLSNAVTATVPIRCEICNIFCDTKDVYDKHVMGKKHQKKLQNKWNPSNAILPTTSMTVNYTSLSSQVGSVVTTSRELEVKRQKVLNGGAAVESVRVCTICNVVCNSYEVFANHLAGKWHAAQAGLIALNGVGPHLAAIKAQNRNQRKKPKKPTVTQSVWCDVCKINCNSRDVYSTHLAGKKHQSNLEKSKTAITDPVAGPHPIIGPTVNQPVNGNGGSDLQKSQKGTGSGSGEDLETKKRKVLESGTTVTAVRVCDLCNVVCNSLQVYCFHIAGQKHAAMVKKAADNQMPTITS